MDRLLSILIESICFFARFAKILSRFGIGKYEEWKPGRTRKILLVGYNGARNTGADARVVAIADQIRSLFRDEPVQITVMTLDKKNLEGYFDRDVVLQEFSTLFPIALYRACCRHHAAILCEGSTLKSTFANGLTLFLCEAAGIMKSQGKPCIAYGSEVGRMEPFLKRAAVRLCQDTYFITRTKESQKELEALGLQGHIGTDTAWLYNGAIREAKAEDLLRRAGWDGKKPLLGVAVINPFCWPVRASLARWIKSKVTGNYEGQYDHWYYFSKSPKRVAAYRQYIKAEADAAAAFLKEQDAFPVIIGMERLDAKACCDLQKALGTNCAFFLSGNTSAAIMTGVLRRLSLLVTSRYHAAVLSLPHSCPIVAVSMDERLDNLMRELPLDSRYLFHVSENGLQDKLKKAMQQAYGDREEIRALLHQDFAQYQEKAEEMGLFLKEYLVREMAKPKRCC